METMDKTDLPDSLETGEIMALLAETDTLADLV